LDTPSYISLGFSSTISYKIVSNIELYCLKVVTSFVACGLRQIIVLRLTNSFPRFLNLS